MPGEQCDGMAMTWLTTNMWLAAINKITWLPGVVPLHHFTLQVLFTVRIDCKVALTAEYSHLVTSWWSLLWSLKISNTLQNVLDEFNNKNHWFLTSGALWLHGIAIDKNSKLFFGMYSCSWWCHKVSFTYFSLWGQACYTFLQSGICTTVTIPQPLLPCNMW